MNSLVKMRGAFLVVVLVLALLLSAIIVSGFVRVAKANPYFFGGDKSPPPNAVPIVISIASPVNACLYRTSNITFAFNASSQETSLNCITRVRYTADWLPDEVYVYQQDSDDPDFPTFIEHEITYQVPDGNHSLIIEALGPGSYVDVSKWTKYLFGMTTTLMVNFTVDTIAPSVSVLSPENTKYDTANATLNFTVSEAVSQISYVLDGGENMTIEGNTTLLNLPNGEHNVTVYATDLAGNSGASEIRYFNIEVPEPFPALVVAVSATSVILAAVGVSVYSKKRKR